MNFFDVMYYRYYVFYRYIYNEPDPEFTAKLSISASESFLTIALSSIFSAYFFSYKFGRPECIFIIILILFINFFFILNKKRENKIIKAKPNLFNNDIASIVIAWGFFLTTSSILFWLNSVVEYFIVHRR